MHQYIENIAGQKMYFSKWLHPYNVSPNDNFPTSDSIASAVVMVFDVYTFRLKNTFDQYISGCGQ